MIAIGLGCRRGTTAKDIVALIEQASALLTRSFPGDAAEPAIAGLFTHADKYDEAGLHQAATVLGLPLIHLDPAVMALVAGGARSCSRRVEEMFALPGIAETAALAGAGAGAVLLVEKVSSPTVTCAIAGPPFARIAADAMVVPAAPADVPAIRAMVEAAYGPYAARMGRRPAPMDADYAALVAGETVHLLRAGGHAIGAVVLTSVDDGLAVNNLVVAPAAQGRGYGRLLMRFAEDTARTRGLGALTLYTNAAMHENIALYAALGFVETGRRTEDGFARVFFRKDLA